MIAGAVAFATATLALDALAQQKPAVPNPPLMPAAPATVAPAPAHATGPALAAQPTPAAQPGPATAQSDVERRLRDLEQANRRLLDEVEQLKDDQKYTQQQVQGLLPLTTRLSGFSDFGFFYVQGNGSGIRPDTTYAHFPEYSPAVAGTKSIPGSWVFMGDPLATMVNANGEPADTDGSRAVTFNPIGNGGDPSFIVNSLEMQLFEGIGDNLTFNAAVDFLPRNRDVSIAGEPSATNSGVPYALGNYFYVRNAYSEWIVPVKTWDLSLYAGKFDSVMGIEYRTEDAASRLTVTPSLICRYTCGYPEGIKARAKFFDDKFIINTALTNGSSFVEMFPFFDEIDTNSMKTISSRVSYRIPLAGETGLELGVSGLFGAQDLQPSDSIYQYQWGADASLDWHNVIFQAEYVHGRASGATGPNPGDPPCGVAPCLHFTGAYGLLGYRVLNWLTPYARVDGRDAWHRSGDSFVYITTLMRTTGGLHFEFGTNVIVKAEYTHVIELGRVPQFADDVATSSLVVKY